MCCVDPQVTKTQSSGEGCKILFSESIRERAVFNGVRGSRRHRASGALDPVKLSSPLLHGVGPSARSLEVRVLQLRGAVGTFFLVNGGENRVLRVYLSRSRTCSFFIAVLMGA